MKRTGVRVLFARLMAVVFIMVGIFGGREAVYADTLAGPPLAAIAGHDFTYGAYVGAPYFIGFQTGVTNAYHAFVRFNKTANAPAGYKVYLRIKVGENNGTGPEEVAIRGIPIAKVWAYKSTTLPSSSENAHTNWPTMNEVLTTPSKYELLDSHLGTIEAEQLLSFDVTTYFNDASNGMLTFFITGAENVNDGAAVHRFRFDADPYLQYEQTVVNNPPVTSDDTATTDEDTVTSGQVSATDVDGDTLTYSISQQAAHGTATVNASTGAWEYTPNADYNGQDEFKIEVSDGNGGTATSTITVTVTAVNDAPVTSDDTATTDQDTPTSGQVSATDVDGDTLTYSISRQAAHGTATVNASTGAWEYTPDADYNGQDEFKIEVSDSNGGTATSTITVTVNKVNHAPVMTPAESATTDEDTATSGQVSATDVDGDTLTYSISQQAAHGTATVNASTGAWEYTPNADYNGQDEFKIEVSDGNGGTATSTITVTVTAVNDAPVTSDDTATTDEDTAASGQVSATDVDGDTLTYSISQQAAHGTATVNASTGAWEYTPDADYNGQDEFKIEVSDGNGGTATSTITVTVTAVNDAPELSGITVMPFEILDTETAMPFPNVSVADADEGQVLTLTIELDDAAKGGFTAASLQAAGFSVTGNVYEASGTEAQLTSQIRQLVFEPAPNRAAPETTETATITITVTDGEALPVTDSQTTVITTSVNDAPSISAIADQSVAKNTATSALAFTITDPDAEPADFVVTAESSNTALIPVSHITLSGSGKQRTVTVEPVNGLLGSATITLHVFDASLAEGTTSFKVSVGNAKPVVTQPGVLQVDEDDVLLHTLTGTDLDQDPLTFSIAGQAQHGLAAVSNGNQLSYTPNPDYNGTDSLSIKAFDGTDESDPVTFTVTVNPVNDKPVAENASYSVTSFSTLTKKLHATDVDGDSLTFRLLTPGTKSVSLAVYGDEFVYVPRPGELGLDSFTYVATDGQLDSDPAVITVTIFPSGIADLSALSTSTGGMTPAFDKNTLTYEETVAFSVTSTTVTAAVYDPNATVTIGGQPGLSAVITNLAVGLNEIPVVVTPPNASDPVKTYTIRLFRTSKAQLSSLAVSAGAVSPVFSPERTAYQLQVAYGVTEMTVTPVMAGEAMGITVNGSAVDSGQASGAIPLELGVNTITIVVKSSDGLSDVTYTLTVTRAQKDKDRGSSSGSSSSGQTPSSPSNSGIAVYVDGVKQEQTAVAKSNGNGQTVITIDNDTIAHKLETESNRTVTIPYTEAATSIISELNGKLAKTMEDKSAVLEIKTALAAYTLPAAEIQIDEISRQLGSPAALEDIQISINIAASGAQQAQLVYANEADGSMKVVVPPVDFQIIAKYGDKQVVVSAFNSYVERTIPVPAAVDPSQITTGIVLGPNGQVSHVPTRITQVDGTYYAVISSLSNSTYSVVWNPRTLEDVEQHWSKADVNDLTSRLVIQGTSETRFSPDLPITRAEFAAIMVRGLGLKPAEIQAQSQAAFPDVTAGDWYAGYTETAAAYGLINGYENGDFAAQRTITREEAITIIARAMKLTKLDTSAQPEALAAFADQARISGWAKDAVSAAVRNQLVEGGIGGLHPKDEVTRAETAALVRRLLQQADLINR
ncbi:Ig-like domain-containing protein [Paenibacillus sp. y28]|uniref:Ig-like domain-containing protein n=1 Tax=Paenibacillus sp. y28 TaxID=3129110 RepID=UPI0030189DFD